MNTCDLDLEMLLKENIDKKIITNLLIYSRDDYISFENIDEKN